MSDHIKRGKQVELLDPLQVERARYIEQRSTSGALVFLLLVRPECPLSVGVFYRAAG
jgi:hypothetical protein